MREQTVGLLKSIAVATLVGLVTGLVLAGSMLAIPWLRNTPWFVISFVMALVGTVASIRLCPRGRSFKRERKNRRKLTKKLETTCTELAGKIESVKELVRAQALLASLDATDFITWLGEKLGLSFKSITTVLRKDLATKNYDPLEAWGDYWLWFDGGILSQVERGSPSWSIQDAFKVAKVQQIEEFEARKATLLAEARVLQKRVDELSVELGLESTDMLLEAGFSSFKDLLEKSLKLRVDVEETAREELSRLRAELAQNDLDFRDPRFTRIAEIEEALLAEQPNDGPHRKAAGISTNN